MSFRPAMRTGMGQIGITRGAFTGFISLAAQPLLLPPTRTTFSSPSPTKKGMSTPCCLTRL